MIVFKAAKFYCSLTLIAGGSRSTYFSLGSHSSRDLDFALGSHSLFDPQRWISIPLLAGGGILDPDPAFGGWGRGWCWSGICGACQIPSASRGEP